MIDRLNTCMIPESDAKIIKRIYRCSSREKLNLNEEEFLLNLHKRAYTEWCEGEGAKSNQEYFGQGFTTFVDNETLYAVQRGYKNKVLNSASDARTFNEVRHAVLEAVVKRGIHLFGDWQGSWAPPIQKDNKENRDPRNLRIDLRDYLGF